MTRGDSASFLDSHFAHAPFAGLAAHLLAMAVFSVCAAVACGQDPAREPAPRTAIELDDLPPLQKVEISDGRSIFLPADLTLEQLLEGIEESERGEDRAAPRASVSSIELTGEAQQERAQLTARIKVQVRDDGVDVPVRLALNEAVLLDTAHHGEGTALFGGFDRESGYFWWLRGAGEHELELSLGVPIKKSLAGRRLQLSLPPTAVSHLELALPLAPVSIKTTEQTAVKTRPLSEGGTEVDAYGLGERLDLSWQPVPMVSDVETMLETGSFISAELMGEGAETVVLDVKQTVHALQGSFAELTIDLPPGFEPIVINSKELRRHRADPDDPSRVTVVLNEPTSGPVNLEWLLRGELTDDKELVLDGFTVEDARAQSGQIAVRAVEGYRVAIRDEANANVLRINARDLELRQFNLGEEDLSEIRAYRFLQQPFRLALGLDAVEPYYTVEPQMFLYLADDHIQLDVSLPYQVFRGGIQEVALDWPQRQATGWVIEGVDPPGLVERYWLEGDAEDETVRIRLVDRQSVGNGRDPKPFQLRLRARKSISEPTEPVEIGLPRPTASSQLPPLLVVANAENVESEFSAVGATSMRPLSARARQRLERPEAYADLRQAAYRIESSAREFTVSIRPQSQRIATETEALAELDEDRIQVTQHITYDVAYAALSQVRLLVPDTLRERIEFLSEGEVELIPQWTDVEQGGYHEARIELETPRLGQFSVLARFAKPLPAESTTDRQTRITVPFVQSSDAEFDSSHFQFAAADFVDVTASDPAWILQLQVDERSRWQTSGAAREIPLVLATVASSGFESVWVSKALIRSVVGANGVAQTRADYRLTGTARILEVIPPAGSRAVRFWWNGSLLPGRQTSDERGFLLRVPQGESRDSLLTVAYQQASAGPLGWTDRVSLAAPTLPRCKWGAQTLWEFVLPDDKHLLTEPVGLTPQYRWRRRGVFFVRAAETTTADARQWVGAADGPTPSEMAGPTNSYLFSEFGPPQQASFQTMSAAMILLLGAGLAFVVGFVLDRAPPLRHVLSLLALGCVVALVGLWQMAPVQLLLQPALLGLVVAAGMFLLSRRIFGRREPAVLALGPPSDYSQQPSTLSRGGAAVGSDDPTIVRQTSASHQQTVGSEAGSSS